VNTETVLATASMLYVFLALLWLMSLEIRMRRFERRLDIHAEEIARRMHRGT